MRLLYHLCLAIVYLMGLKGFLLSVEAFIEVLINNKVYMKKIGIMVFLLLGGCASLEDFQAMSSEQRADYVCWRDSNIESIVAELSEVGYNINETREGLRTGYVTDRYCSEEYVVTEITETCEKTKKDNKKDGKIKYSEKTVCKEKPTYEYKTICHDIVTRVDKLAYRELLAQYEEDYDALNEEKHAEFDKCFDYIYELSPEEAFYYYKNN